MCGIAGLVGPGRDSAALEAMLGALHHRGPDDRGSLDLDHASGVVSLGSTRLAIIDLSAAGHMPMRDARTGNVLVHNGEVYNFRELRDELAAHGERFDSATDTEVVLKAYGRWGRACVERLRGMFAFALWDAAAGELFLVRDRLGEKPLYYWDQAGLAFASEVRALLASGRVPRRLDRSSLAGYLFNGFPVAPRTLVAGVRSLPPGHWMRVAPDGRVIEVRRYWSLPPAGERRSEAAIDEIRQRLEESVRMRLVSDVPLGAFLSGGLDSATLVALMARAGGDVRTFSVAFDETAYDESRYSRWVAARFGTRHTEVRLRRSDFEAWLPAALAALDQPSFDGLNTYCVSRAARQSGLTVALSGTGADELFGGYPFFGQVPWLAALARGLGASRGLGAALRALAPDDAARVKGPVKLLELTDVRQADAGLGPELAAYQTAQLLFPRWSRAALLVGPEPGPAGFGLPAELLAAFGDELRVGDPVERASRAALRLFLGERCLRDADAMSMAHSLELRAPFVDHRLVESVLAVPARWRCRGAPDKPFEWELVRPYLGDDYPRRRKQGFVFPFEEWLRGPRAFEALSARLGDPERAAALGFRAPGIARVLDAFLGHGRRVPWSRVWALYALFEWCERHGVRLEP